MQINSTAINFMSVLIKFICIAVVVAIVIAMIKGVKELRKSKSRNKQMDKKLGHILNEVDKEKNGNIIINMIFCLIFPLSLIGAMVSPMAFDSPGSTESIYTWIFFLSTFSLPAVILISVMISFFLLFKSKLYNKAIIVSIAPIIYFAAMFLLFNT
ncbi:hypothetical protein [Clostridium beijerinckii]|uniref:Pheromone shutdown protein TraB n=1 Tax=Clostridium beijerinckii TaxID=1520 RepID=A0A9Q5CJR9_CLOBE|nr:hypothetical protein [Clostridium beijerinckii]AQS06345.1 hypothetical protein CLBIJ_37920 [Clostridium beijerinckii]MBA2885715.1 pheromone shutdown protein TraB [Clostridium beijerinckii]MBA2900584.1 pheromone shutdown protein TraB [Clostridium beijerinckii]MBA2910274.1 pheromone shutdown protein TraB [Clostridium beijerinckii]MBA9014042.1 pheromone shutdown protein TraB [Clostridium beijerinckii]